MPVPIPVPLGSLFEVRMIGFADDQQTITTFWYRNLAAIADEQTAVPALLISFTSDNWVDRIRPALSTNFQSVYVEGQVIRPVRYRSFVHIPINRAGLIGGDMAPSGVSVVVRRQTPRAGRSQQGRIYLPGIPMSAVDQSYVAGAWYTAHRANLQDAVTENLTTPLDGDFMAVVFHPGPVTADDEVTVAYCDNVLRYQRRREVGVGI